MLIRRAVVAAAALVVSSGVSLAQMSAIAGTVKGEDGKPLQGATVKIERIDIKGNYKTNTKKKGDYYHGGLPLGRYNVILEVNGREVDRVQGVKTGLGDPAQIDFDLQKRAQEQQELRKAAESGKLTAEQQRQLSPEAKAQMEKQMKEQQAAMAKNKALNDAFNTGMQALQAAATAQPGDKPAQYTAAIDAFKKASELDAKQHVVWAQLGDSCIGLAKTKTGPEQDQLLAQGLEAWAKAIELNPNDGGYHNNFALALANAKKFPEAQAELEKAATLEPAKAGQYFYNLGALLVNNGQNEPAGEAFKKAIEADPNYANAHYQYGVTLIAKAQTTADGKVVPLPGTKEAFETYLRLQPTGMFAEAAKGMLASLDSTVDTQYINPAAPQKKKKK